MIEKRISIFSFNWVWLFFCYGILLLSISWLTNTLIFTDSFYYSLLGNRLGEERIAQLLEINKKYKWLGYVITPVLLLLKWLILAGVVYVGLFLFNKEIAFRNCFKIVQLAELAMLFAAVAKLAWFMVYPPQTLEKVQYFYPLAITQLFNPNQIPKYLIYPLQQINVFEVFYWLFIAGGIQAFTQKTFAQSLKVTALSYGVAMAIWCLVIVFIQLQFS